ncbi:hypothetical protein B0H13DRAFT_1896557 [Mycena leptocephala]|nr:hypothetical protein B0H13DRAFT_1896557 [Mycena leptocephala]
MLTPVRLVVFTNARDPPSRLTGYPRSGEADMEPKLTLHDYHHLLHAIGFDTTTDGEIHLQYNNAWSLEIRLYERSDYMALFPEESLRVAVSLGVKPIPVIARAKCRRRDLTTPSQVRPKKLPQAQNTNLPRRTKGPPPKTPRPSREANGSASIYFQYDQECLASVTSRKGVSRQEIKKRIQQKYNLDTPRDSTNCKRLNRAIRGIIEDGGFWQPKVGDKHCVVMGMLDFVSGHLW